MKILVVSDTHGDSKNLYKVIMSQLKADVIIHLGDGAKDIDKIKNLLNNKTILQVCGNCDIGSTLPETLEENISGKKIFATHGNLFKVKKDLTQLITTALKKGANIVLFGHTHKPINTEQDTFHIINPGSLYGKNGTYGIIDIENDRVVTVIKKVSDLNFQNSPSWILIYLVEILSLSNCLVT